MGKAKKGSVYERLFCKELSLWWSKGLRDDIFWRTAQSGGRATIRKRKGMATADSYGDITAIRREGKVLTKKTFFELKRGYTGKKGTTRQEYISITNLLDWPDPSKKKGDPVLIEWWNEAQLKRKSCGRKRAFVVFRRDRKVGCIVMSRAVFDFLEKKNGLLMCPPYYAYSHIQMKDKRNRPISLMVLRVEDFFKWCDPATLGARKKKRRRKS